ncbi:MAG: NifU family protein, partial [Chloroflexi bacterium]|nr:NifU family protein [Chloroflexota bacterium]
MVAGNIDPGIKFVLDNVQTVVASEGGSLEFLELRDNRLSVRYNKGHNEECPECVPGHDLVHRMMESSLGT